MQALESWADNEIHMPGRDVTSIQEAQCSPQARVGIEISLLCLPFSLNFSPLEKFSPLENIPGMFCRLSFPC